MLEIELRPEELMAEQRRRFARDVEWLKTQRSRFVSVDCPTCDQLSVEFAWAKYGFEWMRCQNCGTVFVTPRPSPKLLGEYYRRSEAYAYWAETIFPASDDARRRISRERAEHIGGMAGGTLLDIGGGYGTFAKEAAAFFDVTVMEPSPALAEACRERGIRVIEAMAESGAAETFDVVSAFEVIEHTFDPGRFITEAIDMLKPGGLLVLTCPNVHGFEIEVLGVESKAIDPEHLNLFHADSLARLMEANGLTIIESETPGRLDCDLVGIHDDGLQDYIVRSRRSSHMWIVGRR